MNCNLLRAGALVLALFFAADALAQDQAPPYLRIDFMKSMNDDYEGVESNIWKPLHQEHADQGHKLAWNFYWINYGDRSEFDYATVNVFADYKSTQEDWPTFAQDFARVHPGVDMDKALAMTQASRKIIRSELWRGVLREGPPGPFRFAAINYMKVQPGEGEAYVALERDWWAPIHRAAIAKGCEGAWAVYSLQVPWGTKLPYNYAAVNFANEWKDGCSYSEMAAEVHPDTDWATIGEKTEAARESVYGVEWVLMDNTAAAPAGN